MKKAALILVLYAAFFTCAYFGTLDEEQGNAVPHALAWAVILTGLAFSLPLGRSIYRAVTRKFPGK